MIFPKRKPINAAQREMIDLNELAWPVTYSYYVNAPWGTTRQLLTVNAPALADNVAATQRLGAVLWGVVTAPAVVGSVSCSSFGCTIWRGAGIETLVPFPTLYGNAIGTAAARENTPVLCTLTGHGDSDGRRRFYLPGAPANYVANGLLQKAGFEALIEHATGCMLGLATPDLGSGIEWLHAYPGILEPSPENVVGIAFRRVVHCRVLWHVEKAPEVTGIGGP